MTAKKASAARAKVTQIRSTIGRPQPQRDTIRCLGLGRIGRTVVHELQPSTLGMLRSVRHLVTVEEITE